MSGRRHNVDDKTQPRSMILFVPLMSTHSTLKTEQRCTGVVRTCKGRTAMSAVSGPLDGMIRGSLSMPRASFGLSVMTNTLAPLALTSSAAILMCMAWSSSRMMAITGVWPLGPSAPVVDREERRLKGS
jgi:hypothetical protein